ncbi:2-oxoacid:ferredoxin oxidoreductase subunit beta [Hoeflea prorocentri]|uniref:2-oxoacid:ferredoxin oxidoreductase subunit beta n=1 Tax=Hoeflea prorocentri TaxID=1922333 RepID=A0A9X3UG89_9HYPH|nr:2-oxoacid:ferredoxin oxidoreductase subunit beta [Hoeflea prorocentri]MCY6380717.1 2-oxoacid:ferredoxin oxidoreductase subunit beta [Hoeflea prorocentri]MDA5398517.1 2-oxoacid:ferredoxin oxidoreductase subunit beta [Hoeflea prorocentri]
MNEQVNTAQLTPADFTTDQEVRWCPGCGDYAILKAVRTVLAEVGARRENTVFVSGIGCSSRFPYYIDTYGFHTIHGRAPAVATGMLLANPDLDVWIITGDGDGLSIGGNHLLHILRRNLNCQILLFNNETYGLTKGQYSPTSHQATRSPSSPGGSVDSPVDPAGFALGCGARFVARGVDTQIKQLTEVLKAAYHHKGASFVEIYQNCIVFNEDVFEDFTAKSNIADHQIQLESGAPLLFGKDKSRGIAFDPSSLGLKTVDASSGEADILMHDPANYNLASALARFANPDNPVATGVLYDNPAPVYTGHPVSTGKRSLEDVLRGGFSWQVGKNE